MKKGTNVQAVALLPESTTDTLALLKGELAEIKNVTSTSYRSNGQVEGFDNKVEDEKDLITLIKMASSVFGKEHFYNAAQTDLQALIGSTFQAPVYKMSGSTLDALMADIALRIQILSVKERKEELEALIKEGEQFLTEKDKFALYQKKVAAKLGNKTVVTTEE